MITISRGNVKVKANIFNLPSKTTCLLGLECHKYCYAGKAEVQYPAVLPSRERNLAATKEHSFISEVMHILKTRKNKLVRIHESGDFYSEEYAINWLYIARYMPEYTFYAYTKRVDVFTEEILRGKPKNFVLLYSVDGLDKEEELPTGFDKVARVSSSMEDVNCDAQKNKNVLCGVQCSKCFKGNIKEIVFKKH